MDRRLTSGTARWARGGAVGTLTVGLGAAAHVAAGGQALGLGPAAVLVALTSLAAVGLSGRRWTVRPLLALFLLAQSGVHVVAMAPTSAPMPMDGSAHGGVLMAVAHAVAAALLVVAVLLGERALVALLDRLVPTGVLRALRTSATRPVVAARPVLLHGDALLLVLRGRAPPALS